MNIHVRRNHYDLHEKSIREGAFKVNHTHVEEHKHTGSCNHDHGHGKLPIVLYFVGLILTIIALFLSDDDATLKNSLFSIATISACYHVVMLG